MHLNSEIALDFIEDRLAKDQKAFWNQHLDLCKECIAEIGRWRELETALRRSHLKSAPEESLRRALRILSPGPAGDHPVRRSVLASIIFDSFLQPALAGVRGASGTARQLIMRAEEFDIHIKIWGEPEHRQLLGQVLRRSGAGFVQSANLHLVQHGERLETATADEAGEFHFADLPEGDLSLQIDLPNLTVIGALNLEER
jgi:hypothetical protein